MSTRRHVLALLASTPFAASCSGSDLPDPTAGWRSPGAGETDPRRFALAHAILAPNPHNTQPWLVELRGEDEMLLYCDLDRRLPFTDPFDRQITMGCGCFLALYCMKVGAWTIEFFPEGAPNGRLDERPLARVITRPRLDPPDPLAEQILLRRTNRNDYERQRPTTDALNSIRDAANNWTEMQPGAYPLWAVSYEAEVARVAQIRDLVWRGFDREMRTRGAQEETYQWLRFGAGERARHRDGLYIDVPAPGVLRAIGMLGEEDIVNPDSNASKQAASGWRRKAETAPAFMWLTTPDDTPTTRLLAGMAYVRMNLAATAQGLAMHPWSQALQEYEAMADLYTEAKALLGAGAGDTVQMLVRVGYAEPAEPAARRDMGDFVRA